MQISFYKFLLYYLIKFKIYFLKKLNLNSLLILVLFSFILNNCQSCCTLYFFSKYLYLWMIVMNEAFVDATLLFVEDTVLYGFSLHFVFN